MSICITIIIVITLGVVMGFAIDAFNKRMEEEVFKMRSTQFESNCRVEYREANAKGRYGGWFVKDEDSYMTQKGFLFFTTDNIKRCTFYGSEYQARQALKRYLLRK